MLRDVYCSHGISDELIRIDRDFACILMDQRCADVVHASLRQRREETQSRRTATGGPRNPCRARNERAFSPGLKIALDPGHIGGEWAKMEERWFKMGDTPPVEEGEMTLRVAKILAPKLRALGARVSFVREKTEPVTPFRPDDFKGAARAVLTSRRNRKSA